MVSSRDFAQIARAISEEMYFRRGDTEALSAIRCLGIRLAHTFKRINPRFDTDKFMLASGTYDPLAVEQYKERYSG